MKYSLGLWTVRADTIGVNGHGQDGQDNDERKLLEAVLSVLVESERQNQNRHRELIAVLRGNANVLGRLNDLKSRLSKIAKALAALDAQT